MGYDYLRQAAGRQIYRGVFSLLPRFGLRGALSFLEIERTGQYVFS